MKKKVSCTKVEKGPQRITYKSKMLRQLIFAIHTLKNIVKMFVRIFAYFNAQFIVFMIREKKVCRN